MDGKGRGAQWKLRHVSVKETLCQRTGSSFVQITWL